jgi:tryptophan 2,3-dioxygenase
VFISNVIYILNSLSFQALQTVYDILKSIKQACPNLQQQNMTFAMKAIQNAIAILHVNERDHLDNDVMRTHPERDHLDIDAMMTQSRYIMAAVMIINKYLTNLIHRTNSEHISY